MKSTPYPQDKERQGEYPERTDSDEMVSVARKAVSAMSEEEAEENFRAAMARVYGGRASHQTTVA